MKHLFFTLSLVACLFGSSAFAKKTHVPDVLPSFYKTFQNAQNVNWSEVGDMLRIGFTCNDRYQYAYYTNDELVVVATEIKVAELPEAMKQQLDEEYKGFAVSQVYELSRNDLKEYCVVIDSATKHITLKGKSKLRFCFEERK